MLRRKSNVLIACDNDETLLGLRDYLSHAGLDVRATRDLPSAWRESRAVDALVLFPDDFDRARVTDGLSALLAAGSRTFAIVITADAASFEAIVRGTASAACVVMPKPVWGWTILDVLRARLEAPV